MATAFRSLTFLGRLEAIANLVFKVGGYLEEVDMGSHLAVTLKWWIGLYLQVKSGDFDVCMFVQGPRIWPYTKRQLQN